MGRRSASLSDPGRWVFNRLARWYLDRPPYPAALVERLVALAGGAGARALDVGAGTGHVALPLAAAGLAVTAIEPALSMLAELEARRPAGSAVVAVQASAERTGLPDSSFDLVVLADAVHWVNPDLAGREAARLLAPGGVLALVEPSFAATPFMQRLAALLARENPKARPRPPGAARQLLALAAPGAAPCEEILRQDAPLDDEGLESLVRSFSYAGPALAPAALDALLAEARRLASAAGGARFTRDLRLSWVRRRGSTGR